MKTREEILEVIKGCLLEARTNIPEDTLDIYDAGWLNCIQQL